MRTFTAIMAITLGLAVLGPVTARAQSAHVADQSQLDRLVASHVSQEVADRQLIHDVLERPQVREVARRAGIDLDRADAAVGTLSGDELKDVARRAREVDTRLAGGGSSVTISTTTIIIALLVIILIIVAVN
jgi:hypothetical protein